MEPMTLGHLAVWRHAVEGGRARARVLHIHGICEHSGRHLKTVEALNAIGVEVVRFDLRGAGLSGGKRQWVAHFSDYVADVAQVYNWIASRLEPLPLFVMGHSLGGGIALYFAAEYGSLFEGLILSAPGYKPGSTISPWLIRIGRVASKVLPTWRVYASAPRALSRDPSVAQAYLNDPLAFRFNTLQQAKVVLDALANLPAQCRKIRNPTLILHGTADRVVLPAGSFELLQRLGSKDRELHYLPGGYHEPHLDLDQQKFFALICRWVEQRLPAVGAARAPRSKQETVAET
jgi:alpha-beta hydrolase superfamily lysophospholipase